MDRSWIFLADRRLPAYQDGVQQFLEFAYSSKQLSEKIRCPCKKCNNVSFQDRDDVEADLLEFGILENYNTWVLHGEEFDVSSEELYSDELEENDDHELDEGNGSDNYRHTKNDHADMQSLLEDYYTATKTNAWGGEDEAMRSENAVPQWESDKFMRLLKDVDKELYPGCKSFTKLSFVVTLMHLKVLNKWSNKSFSMLLDVLKKALPNGDTLPCSYYESKKIIQDLGLDYQKIHACVNDCVLFKKEHADREKCPKCSAPRYKFAEVDKDGGKQSKMIPQKILRYFPLKPRLQRLFISKKTAQDMRWHKEKRIDDEVLRHPADAREWKEFNKRNESFAKDPRNVRLGLATDGFNPFSHMSSSYSTWPVILLPYNLPPWKCLKAPFFILSMLIPGPTSPGNDIDVYLEPLVDELKDLWDDGIETYDSYTGDKFILRAALLWTINDFPAYAMVSGWSTKGYLACPLCNKETCSSWLKHGKKICYMNHRRFLPIDHKWRNIKSAFDGKKEYRIKPSSLTGDDVVEQLNLIQPTTFGKTQPKKRKRDEELNWKKCSIFFKLPYWRTLTLRHNLDVMHIEKNICDNILGTLLDIDGKSKDNIKARLDLQELGVRHQLHPKVVGNGYLIPPACYTLSKAEKRKFCGFLASVKYPDAYAASLTKRVNVTECRLVGLKTHDCHIILQQLLPLSVRGILNNDVCEALHDISNFFKQLCSKALKNTDLECLENQIALTLCKLERIFPPAFFDIMVHLPVHLAREAKLGGPVQYRWMYPIERYLYILKQYVSNKAFPEGSMAEGYIIEECLTFCSMYLNDIDTKFNKVERNYENYKEKSRGTLSVFYESSRLIGKGEYKPLDAKAWNQLHSYVLKNCDEVLPFISEHKQELEINGCLNVQKKHDESFVKWFKERISLASAEETQLLNEDILHLAYGPDKRATYFETCIVNGLKFHTKKREIHRRTQNSGVVVKVDEGSTFCDYYGVLIDIIQLDYLGNHQVVLFKCDWYEGKSVQKDKYNCTSINLSKPWKTTEPFVLASQAQQVFYVNDAKLGHDWKVVIESQARSSWAVLENYDDECIVIDEPCQEDETSIRIDMLDCPSDSIECHRIDIPSTTIQSDGEAPLDGQPATFTNDHDDDEEADYTLEEYDEESESDKVDEAEDDSYTDQDI